MKDIFVVNFDTLHSVWGMFLFQFPQKRTKIPIYWDASVLKCFARKFCLKTVEHFVYLKGYDNMVYDADSLQGCTKGAKLWVKKIQKYVFNPLHKKPSSEPWDFLGIPQCYLCCGNVLIHAKYKNVSMCSTKYCPNVYHIITHSLLLTHSCDSQACNFCCIHYYYYCCCCIAVCGSKVHPSVHAAAVCTTESNTRKKTQLPVNRKL